MNHEIWIETELEMRRDTVDSINETESTGQTYKKNLSRPNKTGIWTRVDGGRGSSCNQWPACTQRMMIAGVYGLLDASQLCAYRVPYASLLRRVLRSRILVF